MEIAITKMSLNGQIVIPSEVRKDAGIKPSTKFLIFNKDGDILLKTIKKDKIADDMELIKQIQKSEEQIGKGRFVRADTKMSDEKIDKLLTM